MTINPMKRFRSIPAVFAAGMLLMQACTSAPADITTLRAVCFQDEVLPVFEASCATTGCHDATASEGYRLDSYTGIMRGIKPFAPDNSKAYKAMIATGENHMPPIGTVALEDRMVIRIWIEQGAPKTICSDSTGTIIDTTQEAWTNPYVCFQRDILPVMQSGCGISGCHDPVTRAEGFNFTTYQGILKGLKPGNPRDSKIYESITANGGEDAMPPAPYDRLPQAQIDSIYNWILAGATDEECGFSCDTTNVTYDTHLASLISISCKGCHSGTSPQGGVRLESYSDLVAAVNGGAVPAVLRASSGYALMPPYGQLQDCDIRQVEIWIDNGMPQ